MGRYPGILLWKVKPLPTFVFIAAMLSKLMEEYDVYVSVKSKTKQASKVSHFASFKCELEKDRY